MKTVTVDKNKILIKFPYDVGLIQKIRDIQDRKWDGKQWTLPLTDWHLKQVQEKLSPLGFSFDSKSKKQINKDIKQPDLDYPAGLYPFQRDAVNFIYRAGGRCIIADEMGVGKTIEALAFVSMFSKKVLIIAPANMIYKWKQECDKWTSKTSAVYDNGKDELGKENVHIMSYNIMVNRFESLREIPYDTIIMDEAHKVKNSKAMRTRVTKALIKDGIPHVMFLSGTPFMNRPAELFPMLNMLRPVEFANYYTYALRYCGAIYQDGAWYFPPNGATNLEELSERLKSIMIRRTKREVLKDLPDLTRTSLPLEIDNIEEYRKAMKDIKEWVAEQGEKDYMNPEHILTKLNILRQLTGKGKVDAAVDLAESVLNDGKKVVLFAHHKEIVTSLKTKLKKYGVGVIDGSTAPKKRQENSNEFLIQDSKIRVMIITVAGAEGIDLFSASDIIFVEREWTPALEEQAESRLHRNGQKNSVNAWYLVANKTVDEKFDALVREKRTIFGQVIRLDEIVEVVLDYLRKE